MRLKLLRMIILIFTVILIISCAAKSKETPLIMNTMPAPKEKIAIPQGFTQCNLTKQGFYDGAWVPAHRVCQYKDSSNPFAWVEGYWACTAYAKVDGLCSNWEWRPSRWAKIEVDNK